MIPESVVSNGSVPENPQQYYKELKLYGINMKQM